MRISNTNIGFIGLIGLFAGITYFGNKLAQKQEEIFPVQIEIKIKEQVPEIPQPIPSKFETGVDKEYSDLLLNGNPYSRRGLTSGTQDYWDFSNCPQDR